MSPWAEFLRRKHTNTWGNIQLKFDKPVMCWQEFTLKVRNSGCLFIKKSKPNRRYSFWWAWWMRKRADALYWCVEGISGHIKNKDTKPGLTGFRYNWNLKVCPIPEACLLVMAQRSARLLGLPETRSLIFLIKNSPDQAEGYLDYLQPVVLSNKYHHTYCTSTSCHNTARQKAAE
jgi:hypothetical protein